MGIDVQRLATIVEEVVKSYYSPAVVEELHRQVIESVIKDLLPEVQRVTREAARAVALEVVRDEVVRRINVDVVVQP